MSVRIKDVARRAGVSPATVSRVLGNNPKVDEELRARVLRAVEELDYQPNRVARSLRVQRSSTIGLIISDIQNPFFTSIVRAVEDIARHNGHTIFVCNSDEDLEEETMYIDLLLAERVAGAIIVPTHETDNPCRKLIEAGIPVVSVHRRMRDVDVDTVVFDNFCAAFELVNHLIDDGHHRIGALFGSQAGTSGRERLEGYTQALQSRNLPLLPHLIRTEVLPKEELGYRYTMELLDLSEPPTALFASNNHLTVGALKAIYERGLRFPDDIGLVAFDEMNWTSFVQPPMTVVMQPTYELGKRAADLLFRRIGDSTRATSTVVLKSTLVVRQSCTWHGPKGDRP